MKNQKIDLLSIKHFTLSKYLLLFLIPLIMDQITKILALKRYLPSKVNNFLSFDLSFNRGISWSFFHSEYDYVFFIVSSIVWLIIIFLIIHTWYRFKQGFSILGEILILAGAVSNFIDRLLHGGVIDFIIFSFGSWSWPIFNFADVFIIIGAMIMLKNNFASTP